MGGSGQKAPGNFLRVARRWLGLWFVVLVVVVSVVTIASARPAAAHAPLVSSEPAAGSTVHELHRVVLRFGEEVEAAGSHLWIENERGSVDLGSAHHLDGDPKVLEIAVPALPSSRYILGFHV